MRVEVRGVELDVEPQESGRPFLWGHGLTSSRAHEDRRSLFQWADRTRYDARGHGRSAATGSPEDYRWDRLALDMLGLADALGHDRFAAGGASMGCATALHAAVVAPGRIEALVLVIPPTAWETRAAQAGLYEGSAALVEREGLAALAEASARVPVPAIFADEPHVFEPDIEEVAFPTVLRGAALSDLPPPEALRRLHQPTLILAWDTDPGHPVSTAEALADLLPNAQLEVAATLLSVLEWPDRVSRFLEE